MSVQEDVVGVGVDGFAPDSQHATRVHLPIGDAFRLPGREMDLLRLDARRVQLGRGIRPCGQPFRERDCFRAQFDCSVLGHVVPPWGHLGIPARQDRYGRGLSGGVSGAVGAAGLAAAVEGGDRYADGVSVVLLGIQQCEGVADALFEELVGELPVGEGTGELQRPGHHAEEAE